jgi:threonine/homoserine/homoserine lactone efflux protein
MQETVALAIGIAASPFPIIPAILLLFTERPRAASFTFLATWLAAIAIAVSAFAVLSGAIASEYESPTWLAWVRIAAGIALIALAVHKWLTRSTSSPTPGWMQTLQEATPRSAFLLALLLSLANPKILLLAAAAGVDIGGIDSPLRQQIIAVIVFATIASISVAAPVLAYTIAGARVLGPLSRAKDWLLRNNTAVMVVVFLVLGALLIYNGAADLSVT